MSAPIAIIWHRHDLRLADNPALEAARQFGRVLPVFIWAPEEEGDWPPGGASNWWLHRSLKQLAESYQQAGSRLVIRQGPSLETLRGLIRKPAPRQCSGRADMNR